MNGWLVVNSFFELKKFDEIYNLLICAAKDEGIHLELIKSDEITASASDGFSDIKLPDFVIFWDKDIYLARLLENAGVRLFNSAETIELCDDKAKTCIRLLGENVCIPETVIAPKTFEGVGYKNLDFLDRAIEKLGLPLVIKEVYGSFGQQVYLAKTRQDAVEIINSFGHKEFIMQKFIAESVGKDIRVNVVGGKAVVSILRENKNDFRSNITNGGTAVVYTPTEQQERMAINAAKALNADFAGVDVLFGENGQPLICEVNSNPHFKSAYDCTGVNLAGYIMKHIKEELK